MTVGEMRRLLEALPENAQLCYSADDERGTKVEVSQVDVFRVVGDSDGYFAQDGGTIRIAVVA